MYNRRTEEESEMLGRLPCYHIIALLVSLSGKSRTGASTRRIGITFRSRHVFSFQLGARFGGYTIDCWFKSLPQTYYSGQLQILATEIYFHGDYVASQDD